MRFYNQRRAGPKAAGGTASVSTGRPETNRRAFMVSVMPASPPPNQQWSCRLQARLMVFRLMVNTFLLAAVGIVHHQKVGLVHPSAWPYVYGLIGLAYLLAIFHAAVFPRKIGPRGQTNLQIGGDLLLAGTIFILTGGVDSAFSFLFIIAVINTAFQAGLKGALLTASLASILYGAILDLQYWKYLEPFARPPADPTDIIINIVVNMGALYLVATLGGVLANQLEQSFTDLEQSQRRLEQLAELNENILASIDIGLITLDDHERVSSINQAVSYITGVSWDEAVGRPFEAVFPEFASALDSGESGNFSFGLPRSFDFDFIRPQDKATLNLNISPLRLKNKEDQVWGRLLVIKDTTQVRLMEAEIKKTENLAAVGELAAGLAHEIRNPLASMIGSWQMISEGNLPGRDQEKMMGIIGREMERLANIVSEFLAFARPPTASPKSVAVAELLENLLQVFEHRQNQEGRVTIEKDLDSEARIYFDPGQFSQVIWNLLQNAVEASAGDIHIKINAGLDYLYPGWVRLTVSDDGAGIAPENLKNIFDPFFTTKPKGTGLGLALVGRIIHQGGGRISVDSRPDQGACFKIYLPRLLLEPPPSLTD